MDYESKYGQYGENNLQNLNCSQVHGSDKRLANRRRVPQSR